MSLPELPCLKPAKTPDHILWVRVDRPEKHHAVNFDVIRSLEKVMDYVESKPEIRVLILSGTGHHYFISGGDLKEFHKLTSKDQAILMSERMGTLLRRIEDVDCWTVACINGDAYGGGCETMLAFDFRIAVKHARFGFTQGRFYLPPGWGGLTRLVERVGRSTALMWLGSQAMVSTDEALNAGLIDKLFTSDHLKESILAFADKLSGNDRNLIKALKQGAKKAVSQSRMESIAAERELFSDFWANPEHFKRVEEFINKR